MNFISKQIQETYAEVFTYYELSTISPNEYYLLTLSSILKILHTGVNSPGFVEGCEDDIVDVLNSLSEPLWRRLDVFEKLWKNDSWISLCDKYIAVPIVKLDNKATSAYDIINYDDNYNLPFIGEDKQWTLFSKSLLDVCYKSNKGECLSLLFKEMAKGERISVGILYRCLESELTRELKDEFLNNCKDLSIESLQELLFLPLTVKKDSKVTDFESAMSILATMR